MQEIATIPTQHPTTRVRLSTLDGSTGRPWIVGLRITLRTPADMNDPPVKMDAEFELAQAEALAGALAAAIRAIKASHK